MDGPARVEVVQWPDGRKGWDVRLRLPGIEDIYLTPWFRSFEEAHKVAEELRNKLRKVQ